MTATVRQEAANTGISIKPKWEFNYDDKQRSA